VTKRFVSSRSARTIAVENVSFSVGRGEFVGLIGASGCGKTTLLRLMAGLIKRDSGSLRLHGAEIKAVPAKIGFVFQSAALMPWKTLRANVATGLNAQRRALSSAQTGELTQHMLELTGLSEFADYLPSEVSGGMQQRTGLARALVGQPDVLLMDEPLGALDPFTRMRLQDEIAAIIERVGTTTVLVTHDAEEAIFLCDRIIVLGSRPGRVKEILDVPLDRPRERAQLRGNLEAVELRDKILELITPAAFAGPGTTQTMSA
jgi:ABC-type nitrate/sulfonate/bicarbonate transport system ATPase subunit